MSRVFLSYDREDVGRARPLAAALEKAGHSVWWDQHIRSGAQYSKEIEEALKRADTVVVLWSERSVESPWVRDEAAAGRDSGRLVPVRIGKVEPPLGFRQYQTTDLSRWKGRGQPRELRTLLHEIDTSTGEAAKEAVSSIANPGWRLPGLPVLLTAFAAAVLIAGLIIWRPWATTTSSPVVAVAPAGASPASQSLARDLLAKLGSLQSTKTDALELVQSGKSLQEPDFTFEVDAATSAQSATANLVLLGGKDRTLLWSQGFEQPIAKRGDLNQQLAYVAAKVLECAVDALSSKGERMRQEILKLHLNGCAGLTLEATDPETLLPVLRRVTEEAPDFEGAWANLLRAEVRVFQRRNLQDPALHRRLRADIVRTRRVNPTLAETFYAESWLVAQRPISGWMPLVEKAVESNPDHSGALLDRMENYLFLGRIKEAVSDAERAVEFDPLSPSARRALVLAYTFAGQFEAAEAELREAERLWPGANNVLNTRQLIDRRFGNARAALARLASGKIGSWDLAAERSFLEARIDRSPANVERALKEARTHFASEPASMTDLSQTLAEFGRTEELVQILQTTDPDQIQFLPSILFRPQFDALHKDRRFMIISKRLGLLDYWRTSGKWPDFCDRADLPYDCKKEAAKLG